MPDAACLPRSRKLLQLQVGAVWSSFRGMQRMWYVGVGFVQATAAKQRQDRKRAGRSVSAQEPRGVPAAGVVAVIGCLQAWYAVSESIILASYCLQGLRASS